MSNNDRVIHSLQGSDPKTSRLKFLSDLIGYYITDIGTISVERAKKDTQIDYTWGEGLDKIGKWYGLFRVSGESDVIYRRRLQLFASAPVNPTIDAIQDTFESLIGLRPIIQEGFETRIFSAGQSLPSETVAQFSLAFNADINKFFETLYIRDDGITVQLGYTSNLDTGSGFSAWLSETDPSHVTDISDSLDEDTGIMTLTGGPYIPATKVDVEYYVIPLDIYDSLEELTANLDAFNIIVQLAKAAGVKVGNVEIVKFMNSWFGELGNEILQINDPYLLEVVLLYTESLNNISVYGWDQAKWDQNNWDSDSTTKIEDVFSYTLV